MLTTAISGGPGHTSAGARDEQISINRNVRAAGTLAGDTLTLHLEARRGEWHPDADSDPGVVVEAFAADGGPLQIPGPLIRVVAGSKVRASVHNTLGHALAVHGLYDRLGETTGAGDVVTVAPGETREIAFLAATPGTYFYWASSDAGTTLAERPSLETQLSGALVVDPRGGAPTADRILVIGLWARPDETPPIRVGRIVINGKSWPNTEHLTYGVGDSVRLRVMNVGAAVHPMHLHGFYFNVDSRGDERQGTILDSSSSPHMVVTERLEPGRTFTLTWVPTRPGNWLFHCHDTIHLRYEGPLDDQPAAPIDPSHRDHEMDMMAGPVMGITVTGSSAEPLSAPDHRRTLRLVARVDAGGTADEPAFGYTLEDVTSSAVAPPPYQPSPTIVLRRGEPVSITVVNQLPEPTSVHWHGIELESYYDGVPGFAGEGTHLAPLIEPGGAFEARFTPPRSGTFIFHTHVNDLRQQKAGLSGPLLVVDSLDQYDPNHDLVLMVTVPRKAADGAVVLLNGTSSPPAREMRAGQHYRLRFINLHTNRPSMRMRMLRESSLLTWRALAKDGRDLPSDQATMRSAEIQMGNGETYDFDFVPDAAGDLRFEVTSNLGVLLVTMPIRVR